MDGQPEKQLVEAGAPVDALIAGKDLGFYWRNGWLPAAIVVVLAALNIVLDVYRYGRWIIAVVVAFLFTWWLVSRFQLRLSAVTTANIVLGALAGLGLAIFDSIWYHQWWYVLNLVRLPVLLGGIGFIVGFAAYVLFRSLLIRKQRRGQPRPGLADAQGSDNHGRE